MADTQTVQLFNANDSVTGRDGGPYLDVIQAQEDEKRRAKVEGREPDLDNPPPNAGIQLNNASQQMFTASVNNLPSQSSSVLSDAALLGSAVKDKDNLLTAAATVEVPKPTPEELVTDAVEAPGGENFSPKAAAVRKQVAKKTAKKAEANTAAPSGTRAKKTAAVTVPENK